MAKVVISEQDVLAELVRLDSRPDDPGETAAEMARRVGRSTAWVRNKLNIAKRWGRLVQGRRAITRLDDIAGQAPVYRILPAKGGRRGQK